MPCQNFVAEDSYFVMIFCPSPQYNNVVALYTSHFQGDTLQNVANELECIINTGQYTFTLSSGASGGEASMNLEYTPSARPSLPPSSMGEDGVTSRTYASESFQETGVVNGTQLVSRMENWTREQINDFVRKLGFLDAQKEGGDKIKLFLHINEVYQYPFEWLA